MEEDRYRIEKRWIIIADVRILGLRTGRREF